MPDAMIDLGDAGPWAPPERPPGGPRRRLGSSGRRIAALVVAVAAAALLVADDPGIADPLFRLPDRVLDARVGDGRLFVTRYEADRPGAIEARTTGGRLLWAWPRETDNQQVLFATAGVVVITSQFGDQPADASAVMALDGRTGAVRWRRPAAIAYGYAGGRVVLQDVTGLTGRGRPDPATIETRLAAVEARTGAPVWAQTMPVGSLVSRTGPETTAYELSSIDELTTDGTLVRRDPTGGAVTSRRMLARPGGGTVSGIAISGGQVIVGRASARGADVFDLDTGRLAWSYETQFDSGLFGCGPARLCSLGSDGIHGFDAGTGRVVWGVPAYNDVFGLFGTTLVIGGLGTAASLAHRPELIAVDGRTGAVLNRLDGWIGTYYSYDNRIVAALSDPGEWTGSIGLYDPRTGRVRIFGRGGLGPTPRCNVGSGVVVCVGNGLTVWRLP